MQTQNVELQKAIDKAGSLAGLAQSVAELQIASRQAIYEAARRGYIRDRNIARALATLYGVDQLGLMDPEAAKVPRETIPTDR